MVAILTGIFGIEHLTLAEDVVQEALARALQTWPFYGVPANPSAWIMRASRNLALDVVRRDKVFREKEEQIIHIIEGSAPASGAFDLSDDHIVDDRLRMMFVCCHPLIPQEDQVALALKTLCGFSIAEISRAFLSSEAAVAKRLTRAKQNIRDAGIQFEIPTGKDLTRRLSGVLHSLYLLFNEGYKASGGDKLIREDICGEALRLAALLAGHPAGDQPATHALMALMLLNFARSPARLDESGNLLRLQEQDRARWDREMIARGMFHFAKSASGEEMTEYHLEAGIVACHCASKDYDSTDWQQILTLYDRLLQFEDSPVVALNRAVVVANLSGPQAGLDAVTAIAGRKKLDSYYLLYAVLGDFQQRMKNLSAARLHFQKAMQLAGIKSEQEFLLKRLQACEVPAESLS